MPPPEIVISSDVRSAEELSELLPPCTHRPPDIRDDCSVCFGAKTWALQKPPSNAPMVAQECDKRNGPNSDSGSLKSNLLAGATGDAAGDTTCAALRDISMYQAPRRIQHPLDEPILLSIVKNALCYIAGTLIFLPVALVLLLAIVLALPFRIISFLLSHRCGSGLSRCRRHVYSRPLGEDGAATPLANFGDSCAHIIRPHIHCHALWPLQGPTEDQTVVHCIITVQGCLDIGEVRQLLWRKIVNATDPRRGHLLYPRLCQKLSLRWYGHAWEVDDHFDVQNHVRPIQDSVAIHSLQDLEACLNDLASSPLSQNQPLWEALVLSDFGDTKCTLLILRLHSLVADSLCLTKLLCTINDTDLAFVYEPRLDQSIYQKLWGLGQVITLGALQLPRALLKRPPKAIWSHVRAEVEAECAATQASAGEQGPNRQGNSSNGHILTWARVPNVDQLLRTEKLLHCSIEELFLSFIAGAFHKHLKLQNIRYPPDIYVSVPVCLDRYSSACADRTCRYCLLPVKLPVSTEGAIPRLWEVQRCLEDALDGPLPYGLCTLAYLLEHILLPTSFAQCMSQRLLSNVHNASGCVATFLRGSLPAAPPPKTTGLFGGFANTKVSDFSLASHRVHSTLFFNPVPEGVTASFTFVLLGKEILLSLSTDAGIFPSADALLVSFQDQIQKLLRQVSGRIVSPIAAQLIAAAKPIIAAASSVSEASAGLEDQSAAAVAADGGAKEALVAAGDAAGVSVCVDAVSTEDKSLEELELLLSAVQRELEKIRGNPHGSREEYLAHLSDFEKRMEHLQLTITQRLRQNGKIPPPVAGGCGDETAHPQGVGDGLRTSKSSYWDANPRAKIHRPLISSYSTFQADVQDQSSLLCMGHGPSSPRHSIMDAFMRTAVLRRHSACESHELSMLRRGNSTFAHHTRMMRKRSRRMSSPMIAGRLVDTAGAKHKAALPSSVMLSP